MIARGQEGLQAMINILNTVSNEYRVKISIKKTKVLKISKGKETVVKIHNYTLEENKQNREFCNLGSMIITA